MRRVIGYGAGLTMKEWSWIFLVPSKRNAKAAGASRQRAAQPNRQMVAELGDLIEARINLELANEIGSGGQDDPVDARVALAGLALST